MKKTETVQAPALGTAHLAEAAAKAGLRLVETSKGVFCLTFPTADRENIAVRGLAAGRSAETLLTGLVRFWAGYYWDVLGERWIGAAGSLTKTERERAWAAGREFHDRFSALLMWASLQHPEAFKAAVSRYGVNETFCMQHYELDFDGNRLPDGSFALFLIRWYDDCSDGWVRTCSGADAP